jgi:hypothetical protein
VKYLALAQALLEGGYQFDVLYAGDGVFNPDDIDPEVLERYRTILVPEARDLGASPARTLRKFAGVGGELMVFSPSPLDDEPVGHADGELLVDFWRHYRDEDRERVLEHVEAPPTARIEASVPGVGVTRYRIGDRQIVHLLDYRYDPATDAVAPATELRLRIPWQGGDAACTLLTLGVEQPLDGRIVGATLEVEIPELDPYAVLVIEPAP